MTGMVRKVDELGRIVIPKEMRRIMGIRTGSSVEILAGEEGIVLRKFSEIGNLISSIDALTQEIYDITGRATIVCDEDKVVSCQGVSKREYMGRAYTLPDKAQTSQYIFGVEKGFAHTFLYPLLVDGFECGYVFVLSDERLKEEDEISVRTLCKFFSRIVK